MRTNEIYRFIRNDYFAMRTTWNIQNIWCVKQLFNNTNYMDYKYFDMSKRLFHNAMQIIRNIDITM